MLISSALPQFLTFSTIFPANWNICQCYQDKQLYLTIRIV